MRKENLRRIAEELIWYGGKSDDGRWQIFINLDFDYTLTCKGSWVSGKFVANPNAFETLAKWSDRYNCKYFLNTMRGPDTIGSVVDWCRSNGLEFIGIWSNPYQDTGEGCTRKCWGVFNIDDINAGAKLVCPDGDGRPYVDWNALDEEMTPILEMLSELLPEMDEEVLETKRRVMESQLSINDNIQTKDGIHEGKKK